MALTTGVRGRAEVTVCEANTAAALGSGALPVFSTPSMIALMEKAARESVQPFLEEGQGTVGTALDVRHLAATPLGLLVRAETELVEIDRRRLVFHAEVWAGEEKIGEGRHERFIVDNERFMAKVQAKLP